MSHLLSSFGTETEQAYRQGGCQLSQEEEG